MREVTDRSQPITKEAMERARETLILRRDTHLDVLIDRLKEATSRPYHRCDYCGKTNTDPFPSEDVKYATDLGLITEQKWDFTDCKSNLPRSYSS